RLALSDVPDREDFLYHPTGPVPAAARQRMVAEGRLGPNTAAYLNDVIAFDKQHERAIAPEPATALFEGRTDANGEAYVGVAARLKTVTWTVFVMFPAGRVGKPVRETCGQVALWCVTVVLLFRATGVYLAGRVLRPVQSLTGALRQVGGGDLSA